MLLQDFQNIVSTAARVKEFTWAKQFIQDYQEKLPAEFQENMVLYAQGIVAFHEKDYGVALQNLLPVTLLNVNYHLDIEMLLCKIYYEINEEQALESKLEAFRKYIERNTKLSDNKKEAYYNFVKLTRRLQLWREKVAFAKYDSKTANNVVSGLEKLQADIRDCQPLVNKKWLSEKANLEQQKFTTIKTEQTN